jgi:hypothetical protein
LAAGTGAHAPNPTFATPARLGEKRSFRFAQTAIHDLIPWLRHLFADSVYNGPSLHNTVVTFGD